MISGMNQKALEANRIIDALGGTNKVAELCEIKPGSVSEWRVSGIPHARLMYLKLLRPELFADAEPQREAA
jgi:hypothetical protein